jgi:hypothetical protein
MRMRTAPKTNLKMLKEVPRLVNAASQPQNVDDEEPIPTLKTRLEEV